MFYSFSADDDHKLISLFKIVCKKEAGCEIVVDGIRRTIDEIL